MRHFLALLAIGVVFVVIWKHYSVRITDALEKDEERLEQFIGDEVVLGGDTLKVVNYSIWNNELQLDNGVKVTPKYVLENRIK